MLRVLALALFAALTLCLTAPAKDGWEKFDSTEGEFSVEMPGKPTVNKTRTRKGDGGEVKTVVVGCHGDSGFYIAFKVILPTQIVKGTEDAELDAERESMAREWNGKVTAERKIRAGSIVGRDFTVRGKPDEGEGTLTIRIREYLSGNAVYIVAVVSRPNRDLPDDTGRFLGSLAIGGRRAAGTPTAEQKGAEVAGWGLAIDPQRDCAFAPENGRLRMKITGARHQRPAPQPILNAPRVMREVDGDFVVTVKVTGEFRPGGRSTNPKSVPFNGAGIILFGDTDNFIRLERAAVARGGRVGTYVNFEEFEGGSVAAAHNEGLRPGDCWLRMERRGSHLQCSVSIDGTTWKKLKPIQTVFPSKLKIGLIATSTSGVPFSVAFEEYKLESLTRRVD